MNREVTRILKGSQQTDGAGVRLVRVFGHDNVKDFDPFLLLDAFDTTDPRDYIRGFPWHPHRGIETVTFLSEGTVEHSDSLGNGGVITDGSCQWMTAGSGIIHQEMPQPSPRMLGLQLWLNLPAAGKMTAPRYRDIPARSIPAVEEPGATVRVIAGRYGDTEGERGDHVDMLMLEGQLAPGAKWSVPVPPEDTLVLYVLEGACSCGDGNKTVQRRSAALFGPGDVFTATAEGQGAHFVLFGGKPLREPVAWGGPIVMNTQQELQQAFEELNNGTFIRPSGR